MHFLREKVRKTVLNGRSVFVWFCGEFLCFIGGFFLCTSLVADTESAFIICCSSGRDILQSCKNYHTCQ